MRIIILAAIIFISCTVTAQDKKVESDFKVSLSGFVKTDFFYDSRQTVSIREGHFLLYPDNILPDADNEDINAKPNFNILSIQSRLRVTATGPEVLGAKPTGVIEADFFGNENSNFGDVNGFRLRHAFVKLNWASTELLAGQYWHPMFIAESFPGTISFNTGAPFQPFSRNPQIRLTQTIGRLKLTGCLFSQRDFTSIGADYTFSNNRYIPVASASSKFIRNSGIPDMHFQMQYKQDSSKYLFGAGVDYKVITPEMYTVNSSGTERYKTDKTLGSFSAIGFVNFKFKPLSVKLEGVYAQNAYDMAMIGGYGIKDITDTATGKKEFTNINTLSGWADFQTTGSKVQFGVFCGYTKNMGSEDSIKSTIYARGSNIDYVYRVSPRIMFIAGKLTIGVEAEYTFAMYGKSNQDGKGGVLGGNAVSNTRALLAIIYGF